MNETYEVFRKKTYKKMIDQALDNMRDEEKFFKELYKERIDINPFVEVFKQAGRAYAEQLDEKILKCLKRDE